MQQPLGVTGPLEFALDQFHPGLNLLPYCRERKADRGLFVGGNHESTTHYSINGGADDRCHSVTH
jgi:hypothetical protein